MRIRPVFFFLLLLSAGVFAQISPGNLSSSHAHLEGITKCTKCHVLGEKVTNAKCLECHTEIRSRMDRNEGYHVSREVRGKDCFDCHSEHHGRKFEMVRFDKDRFDHRLTGYTLTGAHTRIDCRQCHNPEFIIEPELRDREDTYLGLGTACINCHDDYHQGTLENDCTKCHVTTEFAPAEKFNHNITDFVLRGAHADVECIQCHRMDTRNGRDFQHFSGIEFANCNSCHDDPHRNNLGNDCKQCHYEESFTSTAGLRNFNHGRTNFPLRGSHQQVDCRHCHNMDRPAATIFQDRLGVPVTACATCHEDPHAGKFGQSCTECHAEGSWRAVIDPDRFDHSLTDFALEGKHLSVDCRQCHVSESLTDPLPFNQCIDCHEDYHASEFAGWGTGSPEIIPDCAGCHVVEGFSPSLFTIEDHAESNFPLDGGHLATPCFACHLQEDKWHFKNIGERCVDCHEDVHAGEIATEFYPDRECTTCHVTASWTGENLFDHSLTDFTLEGAHQRADCNACHRRDEEYPCGQFAGLSQDCTACHENQHGSQFEVGGTTDCKRCHGLEAWAIAEFDHDETAFRLEGRHVEVDCAACHKQSLVDGQMMVVYRMESFECIDCHR